MVSDRKKILVFGGAGYIGSVLTRMLLERDDEVTVFDRLLFGSESVKDLMGRQGFSLIQGDLRDIPAVSRAVSGMDAVILLAALVGEPACNRDPQETLDVNYLATLNVVRTCRSLQVPRLIFASTDSCYGIQEGLLYEDSPLNPISLYAELKKRAEAEILNMNGHGFCPTVLRLATVYGLSPRMRFDLVINVLTLQAVTKGKIKIFGGRQWRPLVHVRDAARGFIQALEAPPEKVGRQVFNIGSNEQNYQVGALGELVRQALPQVRIETIDQPPDLRDYHVSFDKASKVLGYRVERTVSDGVTEIAEAIRSGAFPDPDQPKYRNA
ncbi:MAG: NAD(P)-dependent oxidoreductase [Pseudomonadota bacterium]